MKLHAKARFSRLWIMLLFISLSMISISAVSSAISIGEQYQGGIVFYVDGTGQHGLIAATRDLPGQYDWQGAKDAGERFVDGGFSDWYLPDKWELNELYKHKSVVGGFAANDYWSSTEDSAVSAWGQYFVNGYEGQYGKTANNGRVRAVRAF